LAAEHRTVVACGLLLAGLITVRFARALHDALGRLLRQGAMLARRRVQHVLMKTDGVHFGNSYAVRLVGIALIAPSGMKGNRYGLFVGGLLPELILGVRESLPAMKFSDVVADVLFTG
jgi:hypothetical protein